MEPRGTGHSYTGQKKTKNEDFILVNDTLGLYMVCDGSSIGDGRWAAETTIKQLEAVIKKNEQLILEYNIEPNPMGRLKIRDFLESSIQAINTSIFQETHVTKTGKEHSSTSLDALLILTDYAMISHIGQSRIAHMRNGNIKVITKDHTRYQEMVNQGWEAKDINPAYKKEITRSIGTQKLLKIEFHPVPIQKDDLFFILSDGYYYPVNIDSNEFRNPIKSIINHDDTKTISAQLSKLALLKDHPDDSSFLTVQLTESKSSELKNNHTILDRQLEILKMIPVFFEIQDDIDALNKIHSLITFKKHPPNYPIVEAGKQSDEFYIITQGTAEIRRNHIKFDESTVGELIGEMGTFLNTPRGCDVIAKTEIELMAIKRDQLMLLFDRHPDIAVKIYSGVLHEVAENLRHTTTELTKLGTPTTGFSDTSKSSQVA